MWKRLLRAEEAAFAATAIFVVSTAAAQDYPSRPIRMVVSFAAGGATDVTTRLTATKLSEYEKWGKVIRDAGIQAN